jgi:hypothetical protein
MERLRRYFLCIVLSLYYIYQTVIRLIRTRHLYPTIKTTALNCTVTVLHCVHACSAEQAIAGWAKGLGTEHSRRAQYGEDGGAPCGYR